MATPLRTADTQSLYRLARPRWQRRLLAWMVLLAAIVLMGLHSTSPQTGACSAQSPCGPDLLGNVAFGLLVAAVIAGFVYPRVTPWLAAGFTASLIISEQAVDIPLVGWTWRYAADVAFVGLCVLADRTSRDRRPDDRSRQLRRRRSTPQFLADAPRQQLPEPTGLPRPGRTLRLAGWLLVLPALGTLALCWDDQREHDARQRVATIVTAEVVAHADDYTVVVRLPPDTPLRVDVWAAQSYPIGEKMALYVDDQGLRQPVSEPYDATAWVSLAVIFGGLAMALWARGAERGRRLRQLFGQPQPVIEVAVGQRDGIVAVFPVDAQPADPAIGVIRGRAVLIRTGFGYEVRRAEGNLLPGASRASLYGIPAPGHWCTVVVDGVPVIPTHPLTVRSDAPLYEPPTRLN